MATAANESYDLAEEWVREQINAHADLVVKAGEEITVAGLNECDCVPVSITCPGGWWQLCGVNRHLRGLDATYRWLAKR